MLTIKENTTYTQEIKTTNVQRAALNVAATIIGELLGEYPTTGEFDQERIVLGTVKDVLSGLTSEKPFVDISSVAEPEFDWESNCYNNT